MKIIILLIAITLLIGGCQKQDVEWATYGNDLNNQRYARVDQINVNNIGQLKLAWQYRTGIRGTFQATPIMKDGVMFVSLPFNHVIAINAKTGKELWRYEHDRNKEWGMCCGPANRGVAIHDQQLFMGTVDARLISLNIKTGQKLWDINIADNLGVTESIDQLAIDDPNRQKKNERRNWSWYQYGAYCL